MTRLCHSMLLLYRKCNMEANRTYSSLALVSSFDTAAISQPFVDAAELCASVTAMAEHDQVTPLTPGQLGAFQVMNHLHQCFLQAFDMGYFKPFLQQQFLRQVAAKCDNGTLPTVIDFEFRVGKDQQTVMELVAAKQTYWTCNEPAMVKITKWLISLGAPLLLIAQYPTHPALKYPDLIRQPAMPAVL
jgi:hypothetical protein